MRKWLSGLISSLLIFLFLGILSEGVGAQERPLLNLQNRGAQYQIGSGDELLIKVNVWGFVRIPGQYLVPRDTDLVSLISYAGGPTENAKVSDIKLVRTTHLGQNGSNGDPLQKIYKYNLNKFLKTGDISLNPQLMPNDTITVPGSTVHLISKSLEFIGKLAVFVQVYYLIRIAKNR